MTVKECCEFMGADYDGVLSRLMKDERIAKYLIKFTESTDYADMPAAYAGKRWENMFRGVHSLKGIALNLGLTGLHKASDVLCEEVRHGALINERCCKKAFPKDVAFNMIRGGECGKFNPKPMHCFEVARPQTEALKKH